MFASLIPGVNISFNSLCILGVTALIALSTLLVSFMFFIWKIAKDAVTHTNGFVKTVLKVFLCIFDLVLTAQVAMFAVDIVMMKPLEILPYIGGITFDDVSAIYLTVSAIVVITLALIFYRNTNRKIYVTTQYRVDGRRINEKAIKKAEKQAKKAEKKAAKKAAKEAARQDIKDDEPVEIGVKTEVVDLPAPEAPKAEETPAVEEAPKAEETPAVEEAPAAPVLKKVVAHKRAK